MRPLVTLVVLGVFAGCFGGDEAPTQRQVSASGGKVHAGWAYDGAPALGQDGVLAGTLDDPANTGSVNASFTVNGKKWVVRFDQFQETKPFMGGGVAFGITEHGDSGVADASIPKIHAKVAAWGTATVTVDGRPIAGVAGDRWSAHLMMSDDTVRQADGRILNAAGTAPYDPLKPADARIVTGDAQAFLKLVHPDGETAARAPVNESKTLTFAGPETPQTVDLPAQAGASSLVVNITVTGAQSAPVGLGRVILTLKDAGGNATKTTEMTLAPNQPTTATFEVPGTEITGPYTLEVKGTGAFSVKVDHLITFEDHPFLVLTWDEPTTSP